MESCVYHYHGLKQPWKPYRLSVSLLILLPGCECFFPGDEVNGLYDVSASECVVSFGDVDFSVANFENLENCWLIEGLSRTSTGMQCIDRFPGAMCFPIVMCCSLG